MDKPMSVFELVYSDLYAEAELFQMIMSSIDAQKENDEEAVFDLRPFTISERETTGYEVTTSFGLSNQDWLPLNSSAPNLVLS